MNLDIIKIAKSMKKEFVEISNSYILGTDVNRCTLSIIYESSPDYYIGTLAELMDKNKPDYWIPEEVLKHNLDGLMSRTFNLVNNTEPIKICDNLKDDEFFLQVLSNKAADGADLYRLDTQHMMYTFSSLHPINKSDRVSCSIYNCDERSYIANFIIDKKKYKIHEFIRYLYL